MSDEIKLGLIFSKEQTANARLLGLQSDEEKVRNMTAPWDYSGQPDIVTWTDFSSFAKKQVTKMNALRPARKSAVFTYLNKHVSDIDGLFGTTQQQNDCTAWAASRCYLSLVTNQIIRGAEQEVEAVNQMALYAASSGYNLSVGGRIPNGGRTIYAIAEAGCTIGNSPTDEAGDYDGRCYYTEKMKNALVTASKRQIGWATYDSTDDADAVADDVILATKAGYPVLFGNSIAVQDGYDTDDNGVCVARVSGAGWGGGHAQSWIDYKNVNGTDYVLYANSHGNRHVTSDGTPGWTVWMTRDIIKSMVSSYFDMMIATWAEAKKSNSVTDLNTEVLDYE